MILTADDTSFASLIASTAGPILVDFWAPRCPPCLQINSVLAEIATQYADQLTIVKVNADDSPATARDAHVLGMPTLQVYVDGVLRQSTVGSRSKTKLLQDLRDYLPMPTA